MISYVSLQNSLFSMFSLTLSTVAAQSIGLFAGILFFHFNKEIFSLFIDEPNALEAITLLITFPSLGLTGIWCGITITSIIKGVVLPLWFLHFQRKHLISK